MTFGALWLFGDERFDPSGSHALIIVLPLLVTNIVATSLMAYKMWCTISVADQGTAQPPEEQSAVADEYSTPTLKAAQCLRLARPSDLPHPH
ncbi:hypothetical protein C8J57DRAFT_1533639 [Mycena rebaudengoi]|nr:hypothetical protein C8J57DRAFT_1533639 [Mycena rebaudengoi]